MKKGQGREKTKTHGARKPGKEPPDKNTEKN